MVVFGKVLLTSGSNCDLLISPLTRLWTVKDPDRTPPCSGDGSTSAVIWQQLQWHRKLGTKSDKPTSQTLQAFEVSHLKSCPVHFITAVLYQSLCLGDMLIVFNYFSVRLWYPLKLKHDIFMRCCSKRFKQQDMCLCIMACFYVGHCSCLLSKSNSRYAINKSRVGVKDHTSSCILTKTSHSMHQKSFPLEDCFITLL